MPDKVTLYPIHGLGYAYLEPLFDRSVLPLQVVEDITIEDVSQMFNEETFAFGGEIGRRDREKLQRVEHAFVHRYKTDGDFVNDQSDQESKQRVRNVVACLRLIRPMRQRLSTIQGVIREDGSLDVRYFDLPREIAELPEVQKLFHLRNLDVEELNSVVGDFLGALGGQYWKFRMAVEFHEAGYFQDSYWKARYLLWCSALEAIYTSNHRDHRGSLVAKERIRWFLGAGTSIYEPGDVSQFLQQPNITVSDVVDDLCRVRNFIAHGDRLPDEYFQRTLRRGLNGPLNVLAVLGEALSFIVRRSLLRILHDGLLDHFASAAAAEAHFDAAGLTLPAIKERQKQKPDMDEEE